MFVRFHRNDKQDPKTAAQLSDSPETDMYAPKMGFHMSESPESDKSSKPTP